MRTIGVVILLFFCLFIPGRVRAVEIQGIRVLTDRDGLPQNSVYRIFQDSQGFMWMSTGNGISCYDGNELKTFRPGTDIRSSENRVQTIVEDDEGLFWIKTESGIVKYYDPRREAFFDPEPENAPGILDPPPPVVDGPYYEACKSDERIGLGAETRFITDNMGGAWVSNMTGVLWRFRSDGTFEPLTLIPPEILSLISAERYDIYCDSRGITWISTFGNGLFALDPQTGRLDHFTTEQGLPTNYLYCVTEDWSGEIWLGTDYSGAVKISLSNYPVRVFYPAGEHAGDRRNAVRLMHEDSDGRFWFGTRDGELFICDSSLNTLHTHRIPNGMAYTVAEDTLGNKWVGTKRGQGVTLFSPDGKTMLRNISLYKGDNRIAPVDVFSILCDRDGRIWVGSFGQGLFLAEWQDRDYRFHHFLLRSPEQNRLRGMIQARDGLIWAGSDEGVLVFDPQKLATAHPDFITFSFDPANERSLSHNEVKVIFEDSQRRIWLGTAGGGLNLLERKDPLETSTFRHYNSRNGLNNESIQSIEEDNEGFLWVSTESGLAKFDPRTGQFDNFFFSEERGATIFNERSSWKREDGSLMFGSYNGVYSFYPTEIAYDRYAPPVVITGMQVNGSELTPGADGSPLAESVTYAKNIRLKHSQHSFNLAFALMNYVAPEHNQYTYILEGYEKEWNPPSQNHIAAYRNVPPGTYRFRVKGSNGFGVWSDEETVLEIRIFRPWWASWWAIVAYIVLAGFAVYFSWRIIRRMNRLNTAVEVEKQLTEHKLRFFTNISHEFRTPLTILRGSVETLSEEEGLPAPARKQVDALSSSSKRLLRLVDQLLEFRSLQHRPLDVKLDSTEIVCFFQTVFEEFTELARRKAITFSFESDRPECTAMLDRDKMEKIVYNLLSNAFKNTPEGGEIKVELVFPDDEHFALNVSDSGPGIPEEKRNLLFKRFARINDSIGGTGVGLHLASELAAAHRARIEYSDAETGGACFSLFAPLVQSGEAAFSTDLIVTGDTVQDSTSLRKPWNEYKIALVEDDDEVRGFIEGQLMNHFTVVSAPDGEKGLELILNEQPDLVVCDVMMPGRDGFEITRLLKQNFETSHIPVILLTAYTSEEHRLAGIRTGADAYITKPFSPNYLLARITKLLEQRENLQSRFTRQPGILAFASSSGLTDKDKVFLDKLHGVIETNMDNGAFSMDDLMQEMGMSRTSFYRKVKGLTGYSPNEYLRIIRLKKAAELFKTSGYNVSEIAYQVGFDDPLYFSKCFKVQFGCSPSQYKKGDTDQ